MMFTWLKRWRQRHAAIKAAIDDIAADAAPYILPVSIAVTALQLQRRLRRQGIDIKHGNACRYIEARLDRKRRMPRRSQRQF